MRSEYYEIIHKWPYGFKKKVCDFYNDMDLRIFGYVGHNAIYRCALCGSTNTISIHHYDNHRGIRAQYVNPETGEVDFDDFSKFIPLCRSCHGTIHAAYGELGSKGVPPLLQFLWGYMEVIHQENGYWVDSDPLFQIHNIIEVTKRDIEAGDFGKSEINIVSLQTARDLCTELIIELIKKDSKEAIQ